MQNEFEKQVQKKMEELNFVPSVPVWENIEKQIRKKKDRKMLLWLPILFLVIGGGIWWFNSGSEKKSTTSEVQANKQLSIQQNTNASSEHKETYNQEINKIEPAKPEQENPKVNQQEGNIKDTKISQTQSASLGYNSSSSKKNRTNHSEVKTEVSFRKFKSSKTQKGKVYNLSDKMNITASDQVNKSNEILATENILVEQALINPDTISTLTTNKNQILTLSNVPKNDSITNAIVANIPPKKKNSKWAFGLSASVGSSGIGDGLKLFPHTESMYAYSPGTSTGSGYVPYPSSLYNGLSFSFGLTVKKQLSKRFGFLTGLQYNYYSTEVNVGQKVVQDTMLGYSYVSQYYRNSAYSSSDAADKYHNGFHFISVPLYIDFQVLRKVPLHLTTGFSLQQLVYTNGLLYDNASGVYYQDKSAYKKTQLFYDLGLNYSILKSRSLSFGPWMQYGLSQIEKNNSNQHLYSFGLRAQYFILKK